jgi:mycofactocin precursor
LARDHCPFRELRWRGRALRFGRASAIARSGESFDEMTVDQSERTEEEVFDADELLVEEVSIDGMCGVY